MTCRRVFSYDLKYTSPLVDCPLVVVGVFFLCFLVVVVLMCFTAVTFIVVSEPFALVYSYYNLTVYTVG